MSETIIRELRRQGFEPDRVREALSVPPTLKPLNTRHEAAALLGLSLWKFDALVREGRGPRPTNVDKRIVRYSDAAIRDWIADRERVTAESEEWSAVRREHSRAISESRWADHRAARRA